MTRFAVTFLLLAGVAVAQQFPFSDGPLEESLNSNKIFFKVKGLGDLAGVWKGVNSIMPHILFEPWFRLGGYPYNATCEMVGSYGWNYDTMHISPRSYVIEAHPEAMEDGSIGSLMYAGPGRQNTMPIMEYRADGMFVLTDGGSETEFCHKWRPYLDWEVGKTMVMMNYRYHYWPDDNNMTVLGLGGCNYPVTHPLCTEGPFTRYGEDHVGIVLDRVDFFECIAGPCLDLAHGLPGFVQTQGYVPADAEETLIGSADEVVVDNMVGK